ncbi:MAG: phosphoserine phosphatase SerB [Pseudomonadota bacterium]
MTSSAKNHNTAAAIACFVAADGALNHDLTASIKERLSTASVEYEQVDWLADATACDIPISGTNWDHSAFRDLFQGLPVDVALVEQGNRRKKVLVADMDSTIVTTETLDEIADQVGIKPQIAQITARAMRGDLDFHDALRERISLLKGVTQRQIDAVIEETELSPGAMALVRTMKSAGARTALVSGGFKPFTSYVRGLTGFDSDRANQWEIADGVLTGAVVDPILDKSSKVAALREELSILGVDAKQAVTVGDGANDLPMLLEAGLGVAYYAKPAVEAAARYSVKHGDLTALLYFQGYRRTEFQNG